jgi:adenylosuccinate lyase
MRANLESGGGLVYSGQLLLDLVEHGILREDAYRIVQRHAMRAWNEGLNFRELVMTDPEITSRVPQGKLAAAFELKRQLRNVDKIFERVFGTSRQTKRSRLPFKVTARKQMAKKAATGKLK